MPFFFWTILTLFFKITPTNPPKPTQLFPLRFHRVMVRSFRGFQKPHPNDGKADADGIRKDLIPEDLSLVTKVEDYWLVVSSFNPSEKSARQNGFIFPK